MAVMITDFHSSNNPKTLKKSRVCVENEYNREIKTFQCFDNTHLSKKFYKN